MHIMMESLKLFDKSTVALIHVYFLDSERQDNGQGGRGLGYTGPLPTKA